jgi:hypothetical protein
MNNDPNSNSGGNWLRSRSAFVFFGFAAIALFFLWEEHKAHLLGALPYLLVLLCPLMHFFHGGHGGRGSNQEQDKHHH